MSFVDEAKVQVQAGGGGNGCVSFRREKYVPYGGPDGGNGGRGGDVYFVGSRDKASLLDFKFRPLFEGRRGEHGKGSDMDGRSGDDCVISVPVGTLIYENETGELLCDLSFENVPVLVAKGGRGGRGNLSFVSSTNRAPRQSTKGGEGEKRELRLELQLLADVGLVGLPNAGKSSFLGRVSRARPKVADYPFTTLTPHLGVVHHKDRSFVVADLPGLIEGASQGVGLGFQFLRHVRRNRMLLHLVELNSNVEFMKNQIATLHTELRSYDPVFREKQELLVFTKSDLWESSDLAKIEKELETAGFRGIMMSSHSGFGIATCLDRMVAMLGPSRLAGNELEISPLLGDKPETEKGVVTHARHI